ncbi:MAG: 50S ribosomal protein L25 [Patescibacteria group bacterium]
MDLRATLRTITGKKVKALRREQQVPGVVYGHGIVSRPVSVPLSALEAVHRKAGESSLISLVVDGKEVKALMKDLQRDPLSGQILHVDFLEVSMQEKLKTQVPIVIKGEAKAVKEHGAVLVRSLNHLEIECLPQDLIPEYAVDVSHLATIGEVIRVSDLVVPPHIHVLSRPETVVVSIEEKHAEAEAAPPAAAVAAPDLTHVKTEKEIEKAEKDKKVKEEATIKD